MKSMAQRMEAAWNELRFIMETRRDHGKAQKVSAQDVLNTMDRLEEKFAPKTKKQTYKTAPSCQEEEDLRNSDNWADLELAKILDENRKRTDLLKIFQQKSPDTKTRFHKK